MITVSILINGQPIYTRSAVRVTTGDKGINTYQLDDGTHIFHRYDDGAIPLAIQMLKTIHEVKKEK